MKRRRQSALCRAVDWGAGKNYSSTFLANKVVIHVEGGFSDLHDADAGYHMTWCLYLWDLEQ